jgi:MFS family permease
VNDQPDADRITAPLLRDHKFLLLWLINTASTLAMELFSVTVLVAVFEQTESTVQAAGTMVARTLASFILGPVAGVLVDRFPRKNVLVAMDMLRLGLAGVSIWLVQADGSIPVVGVYLLVAGLSAAGVFHRPARLALIPSLAEPGQLVQANSLILASNQIMAAISYTAGGWLILTVPLRQISLGVVALFAIAILAAVLLTVPKRDEPEDETNGVAFARALAEGWRYLRQHPIARPLTVMETVEHLPHGIWTGAVMLAFTTKALQGGAPEWGYQITAYFSGMIVGSLAALALGTWLRRFPGRFIVIDACAAGLLTMAFASSQTVWVAVALCFVFGPSVAMRDVAQDALLQSTVDEGQLGRVYATRDMLRSVMFMFAGLFFAWLSDVAPVRAIYYTGGAMYVLTGLYALSNRALRESRMDRGQQ